MMDMGKEITIPTPVATPFENIEIHSSNAVLVNVNKKWNNRIIYEKAAYERVSPASLTKMMTAIVAIESINDLDEKVTLNWSVFKNINGLSQAGYLPGEEVPAIDLLYGLMLPSGAECSRGLAEYISGTEGQFSTLMNKKAAALGMHNTNFSNSSGEYSESNYSSASDLAILLDYCLNNRTFSTIFSAQRYYSSPTNKHPEGIVVISSMFSRLKTPRFNGVTILGGKTGFTSESGQCLASAAKIDNDMYILITCGAGIDNLQTLHIDDAITIYNAMGKR